MFRRVGTLVWGALGVFHLWLLAQQAWTGRFDHAELLRWGLAIGLVSGLVALRRHGGSLFGDRRSTAMWVLVALLHGPVLAADAGLATQALAETPVVAAQVLCAVTGLALALALVARRRFGPTPANTQPLVVSWLPPTRTLEAHVGLNFLPRPPPIA